MIYDAQGKQIGEVRGVYSTLSEFGGTESFAVIGFGSCAGVGGDVVVDGNIAGFFDGGHLGDMVLPNGSCSNSDGYTSGTNVYTNSGDYMGCGDSEIEAAALLYIFLPELIKQKEEEEVRYSSQPSFDTAVNAAATGAAAAGAVAAGVAATQNRSTSTPQVNGTKSRIAACVLAILFGAWGVHKFYLGYTKEGLIMLGITVVGTFLLPGIANLVMVVFSAVEGIIYLMKDNYSFYTTYELGKKGWL